MSKHSQASRRKFLQQIGSSTILLAANPLYSLAQKEKAEERILQYERKISSNDTIKVGVIGFGIQGHMDLATALKVPGVELAAVCDLYTGRLENAKELYGDKYFHHKKLLGTTGSQRCGCHHYRNQRSLACPHHQGSIEKRKGRLLRKADGA